MNHPYGRMFVTTGNGTYDATTPYSNTMDFGDDDIRLDLTNGLLKVDDSFTPSNQANLSGADQDLGSGGRRPAAGANRRAPERSRTSRQVRNDLRHRSRHMGFYSSASEQ